MKSWIILLSAILVIAIGKSELIFPPKPMDVSFSLVIPTIYDEVKCLRPLLVSLTKCTVFPNETIIVVSGLLSNESDWRRHGLLHMVKEANTIVKTIKLVEWPGIHFQRDSRNYGANMTQYSHISFIDGDDVLHPQRFEMLGQAFRQNPHTHVFLHTSVHTPFTSIIDQRRYPVLPHYSNFSILYTVDEIKRGFDQAAGGNRNYWTWCCDYVLISGSKAQKKYKTQRKKFVHNSGATMARIVWETLPQAGGYRTEDAEHISRIVSFGFNVAVLNEDLALYIVHERTKEERLNGKKNCDPPLKQ